MARSGPRIDIIVLKLFVVSLILLCAEPGRAMQAQELSSYWIGSYESQAAYLLGAREGYEFERLAKAVPDECFRGIGDPGNAYYPDGLPGGAWPDSGDHAGRPKVNQAYVWGLARQGDNVWFGTGPNIHCLVMSSFLAAADIPAHMNESWVCEFDENAQGLGDFRPARFYVYDLAGEVLVDKTPLVDAFSTQAMQLRLQTLGIRSAGSLGDVVFLAGPGVGSGVNLFAFNGVTGQLIGAASLPQYSNIRKWTVVNGQLYTGVRKGNGGAILRWTGSLASPFSFQEVGLIDSEPAELAAHEGRLFVSTWPALSTAGLYMSPLFGADGKLTDGDASGWRKVWDAKDFEPDQVVAQTYGGGALASFDGFLYWGTMHVPGVATVYAVQTYGLPTDQAGLAKALLATNRAVSIFRGKNFCCDAQKLELLYGSEFLPAYDQDQGWTLSPNRMGLKPTMGPAGFGNPFNNYTWTMAVRDGLFVGTMDWSYLVFGGFLEDYTSGLPAEFQELARECYGADLYRFASSAKPAEAVNLNGAGNYLSYGFRTMLASDDGLYLGMANPMNLAVDQSQDEPSGGWELLRMTSATEGISYVDITGGVGRGFGNPWNRYAWSMAELNGDVFVGTLNLKLATPDLDMTELAGLAEKGSLPDLDSLGTGLFSSQGGEVWRYSKGAWKRLLDKGGRSTANMGFRSMAVYNGRVFAGTANQSGCELYLFDAAGSWARVEAKRLSDRERFAESTSVRGLTVFDGKLLIGTQNATGGELWAYDDTNGLYFLYKFPAKDISVAALREFGGKLFAGTWNTTGMRLYVMTKTGFADVTPANAEVQGDEGVMDLASFGGRLFMGTVDVAGGFSVLSSACPLDPNSWKVATDDGFGRPGNDYAWRFQAYGSRLYLGVFNSGLEDGDQVPMNGLGQLWATKDGEKWDELVDNGFDGQYNYGIRSMTVAGGNLVIGTASNIVPTVLDSMPGGLQIWVKK